MFARRRNVGFGIQHESKFETDRSRRHFISKVLTILSIQMGFTMIFGLLCMYVDDMQQFLRKNYWLFFLALGICFVTQLVLVCFSSVARKKPINYILLAVFTIFFSIGLGYCVICFDPRIVFQAFGTTLLVCVGLTLFALFAPCDFTGCGPFLCCLGIVLFVMSFVAIFVRSKVFYIVICAVGILLFSLYLVYDLQLMIGNHKNEYSEDDYIFAALSLYIDIIQLFLHILMLFGLLDD